METKSGTKRKKKKRIRSILVILYAIYISFILISTVHYIAEREAVRGILKDGEYESHLTFPEDGAYGHYRSVELFDKSSPGRIDLKHTFDTNTLYIQKCENIKHLEIDCQMMYENKCQEVLEKDPTAFGKNYYKDYFKETNNGLFTVIVNTETPIESLQFYNTPMPTSVLVNNKEWWETQTSYYSVTGEDVIIEYIPEGTTTVKIYFQPPTGNNPIAHFTASKYVAYAAEIINFDASGSSDEDGTIDHYIWDYGDGGKGSGVATGHAFSEIGRYAVVLTVRDNEFLEDTYAKTIYVVEATTDTDGDGVADEIDPNPHYSADTDGDGLSDDYEKIITDTDSTSKDSDGDGYDDDFEIEQGTDPNNDKSTPAVGKEAQPEEPSDQFMIIAFVLIVVIVVMIIIASIIRKRGKKEKPESDEAFEEPLDDEEPEEPPESGPKKDLIIRRPPKSPPVAKSDKPSKESKQGRKGKGKKTIEKRSPAKSKIEGSQLDWEDIDEDSIDLD